MDLITQGILGAAIAEAGWRHKLGKGAILAGIFFGLMPDFDVISNLGGPWTSMVHHRGFTHSVFFAPLMAPLGGWLAWRLTGRKGEVTSWMHCAFWALLTHPLLDVFTTYGTQLLTPLSDERFSLDGISIIDPLYTLPLLFSLIIAWFTRKRPQIGRRLLQVMLALTTAYLGLGYMTGQRARQAADTQLSQELDLGRVRAAPTMGNLVLWRVMAEDQRGDTHVGLYSVTKENQITFATRKRLDSPLVERALLDRRAQIFAWFAQDWVGYRVDETEANTVLYMDDLRYGGMRDPLAPMWGAKVTFGAGEDTVTNVERINYRGKNTDDLGAEVDALIKGITEGPE